MKKYFPPAAPISHQERAKSAECPKKPTCLRKNFLYNFKNIFFRCNIFEENVSWKNIFPQQPLLATRSVQSQQNTLKGQHVWEKSVLYNFKNIFFRCNIFEENFSWKNIFPQQPLLATRSVQSRQNALKSQHVWEKKFYIILKIYFSDVIFLRKMFREKIFSPSSPY